jgi:hypothetical protein
MRSSSSVLWLLPLLALSSCEKKAKIATPSPATGSAPAEVASVAARLLELAKAQNAGGLRAEVDPEIGVRLAAAIAHARAQPLHRPPILEKATLDVKNAETVRIKREELVTRLAALAKQCVFLGAPEARTPRWPPKRREGWDFIHATAALVEDVYDAYARCKTGYNLEVRFARRLGQKEWRVVAVRDLPFGVNHPTDVEVARWE